MKTTEEIEDEDEEEVYGQDENGKGRTGPCLHRRRKIQNKRKQCIKKRFKRKGILL